MKTAMSTIRERYDALRALGLKLDLTRGQPGDDNFELSNAMLTIVDDKSLVTPSGVAIRNYPGGIAGLKEARELFAPMLGVAPDEVIVGNNASLELEGKALMWAMLRGVPKSPAPWCRGDVKFIVTVPGYDRHFLMLERLGIGMIPVAMKSDGPDIDAIEKIVASDATVKGLLYVPTYSNPTGDTTSQAVADRLGAMKTAAPDFTIFADDAYAVHHLDDTPPTHPDLLGAAKKAGNPTRVILFGSTSKITFAGAGVSFVAGSKEIVAWLGELMGTQMITPNKIEQYRHVLFLGRYPGGIAGLMKAHAKLLAPKFAAVEGVLSSELGGKQLATWTKPKGGYFVSLDTAKPVASKVVQLAKEAGVALTPAGATYPFGKDPNDRNIRISPTRPPLEQVRKAMEVVAVCVQLACE
jgi:DNA-binding transcriptional MocR family regulator